MSSDKRLLLAVGVSFLILVLYPLYLKWITPKPIAGLPFESNQLEEEPAKKLLPEVVTIEPAEAAEEDKETVYPLSHKHFDVEFSSKGGTIKKLILKSWGKTKNGDIVLIERDKRPGAFLVSLPGHGIDFEKRLFTLELLDDRQGKVRFASEETGRWRVVKSFRLDQDKPVLWLDVEVKNLGATQDATELELASELDIISTQSNAGFQPEAFVALRDKLASSHLGTIKKKPYVTEGEILWQALRRHYFSLIVRPDVPANLSKITSEFDGHELMRSLIQFAPTPVDAGQVLKRQFLIYAGPEYYKELKSFDYGFEQILSKGVFGMFRLWLLIALQWSHKVLGNYGWAIILITFAIKLLFTPLTHMSFESMKKMQALQPKLKALQERYKGDQAKLSQEMMDLYKRNKVNPMGGCLPMVLQIPIFIAFYQVLAQTVELKGEPFIFWIRDLSEPDRAWTLPFALPFLGDGINILPILMLGSMVWQQQLTPQTGTPEQQKMMMFMPIVFGFIFYSLPSGLVLYWFVNNMLSIFHQLFVKGKALPHHEES